MPACSGLQPKSVTAETLRGLPIFAGLTDAKLQSLVPMAHLQELSADEPVLQQGGPANDIRVVVTGKCQLVVELSGNKRQHFSTVTRGEIIGWSALLDQATWLTSAKALKPSVVLVVDGAALRALCESDHELGYHVMRNLFAAVARCLQDTRVQLLDMYGHD